MRAVVRCPAILLIAAVQHLTVTDVQAAGWFQVAETQALLSETLGREAIQEAAN